MGRKTVNVQDMVIKANRMLSESKADMSDYRRGVATMIEEILHSTGNYQGFQYLSENDVVSGLPGVRHHAGDRYIVGVERGAATTNEYSAGYIDTWFVDTDETRRSYFY